MKHARFTCLVLAATLLLCPFTATYANDPVTLKYHYTPGEKLSYRMVIRGTTSQSRVRALRDAGAREIHLRISSPPHRFPCFYGIDFPTRTELIAAKKTNEEIAEFLNIESLGYQTLEGLLAAVSKPPGHYCTACFTGDYPVPVEGELDKLALEK